MGDGTAPGVVPCLPSAVPCRRGLELKAHWQLHNSKLKFLEAHMDKGLCAGLHPGPLQRAHNSALRARGGPHARRARRRLRLCYAPACDIASHRAGLLSFLSALSRLRTSPASQRLLSCPALLSPPFLLSPLAKRGTATRGHKGGPASAGPPGESVFLAAPVDSEAARLDAGYALLHCSRAARDPTASHVARRLSYPNALDAHVPLRQPRRCLSHSRAPPLPSPPHGPPAPSTQHPAPTYPTSLPLSHTSARRAGSSIPFYIIGARRRQCYPGTPASYQYVRMRNLSQSSRVTTRTATTRTYPSPRSAESPTHRRWNRRRAIQAPDTAWIFCVARQFTLQARRQEAPAPRPPSMHTARAAGGAGPRRANQRVYTIHTAGRTTTPPPPRASGTHLYPRPTCASAPPYCRRPAARGETLSAGDAYGPPRVRARRYLYARCTSAGA
ncbi:hypothetical protein HYPSUDRAFT_216731 [Hypholoma sublateritium FD-334 SS-4]|uniref:Uncharacterized protein n=1 Tax=Hypholoma sublateritium (strain FD-334 SS-4) TaxID=945553 RepID=A0A0D2MBQ9_HYPSF|nr:hypothetical protein HYPSUDRAFT_216731 [Hypholoma sublateritium FD-334 SS-4]